MEITVHVKAPELAHALEQLAASMSTKYTALNSAASVLLSDEPASTPLKPQMQAPVGSPVQTPPQPQVQSPVVPVAAPLYTMDQLAVAATQLMDAGRQQDLLALLAQFGVQALTMLPKEQYGAFATALRQMGAKI